jgi:hypothetical protein
MCHHHQLYKPSNRESRISRTLDFRREPKRNGDGYAQEKVPSPKTWANPSLRNAGSDWDHGRGALENYWRTLNEGRERRASKNLRRVGSAYPLITFTNLLIEAQPTSQHLTFTYEDSLTRQVIPNQNGRIYTAKGDELVADSIGHTLSYWIDSALFLETDSPTGGKYIEELKISKTNKTILHYRVKLNLPSLKEPVEIRRAFRRSN